MKPPPKVGEKFYRGPKSRRRLYHVRAIIDERIEPPSDNYPEGYHQFVVVMRTYVPSRGWHYVAEDEIAFHVGLYEKVSG